MNKLRTDCAVIVLAAGKGTRMKSDKAKVLHELIGKPMVLYVLETAASIVGDLVFAVVGHQANRVKEAVAREMRVHFVDQPEQLGTGHAVQCALPVLPPNVDHIIILCGDVPLIRFETIDALIKTHVANQQDVTLLAVEVEDPTGYGRIILSHNGQLTAIVEEADANAKQKAIRLINAGIYCVKRQFLERALTQITNANAQMEFYLTDIIGIGYAANCSMGVMIGANPDEIIGINTLDDLQRVAAVLHRMQ